MEGISNFNTSQEEENQGEVEVDVDRVFWKAGLEIEAGLERDKLIKETEEWFESQKERARNRFLRFGEDLTVRPEEIDQIIDAMKKRFVLNIKNAAVDFEDFKKRLEEKRKSATRTDEEAQAVYSLTEWIQKASSLALYRIIDRKLKGELLDQEETIFDLMEIVDKRGKKGEYDGLTHEIDLSLFNRCSLKEYEKTLDHELTHHAMNLALPEAMGMRIKATQEFYESQGKEVSRYYFIDFLGSIDESVAHIVEGRTPDFEAYGKKITPSLFKKIYEIIKKKIETVPEDQRDQYFVSIYQKVGARWREGMTKDEVFEVIFGFQKTI